MGLFLGVAFGPQGGESMFERTDVLGNILLLLLLSR